MRTLEPAQNILCHAHIFCLKSCFAREMLGFVESGFLSRAQTTFYALDKKPDSTNPRISLAKLDLRQKMLAEHKIFFAAHILISSLKLGMERIFGGGNEVIFKLLH